MSQSIRNEVMQASQNWINSFNNGDVNACIERYTSNAFMQVHPFGRFNSKSEISDFWQGFAKSNPTDLVYKNVQINVLSATQAILSANWSMNIASGFITKELWILAEDGQWYLEEDDFSVLTQLTEPLTEDKRTALVLVDFQNDYFEGGKFPLEESKQAAMQAGKLLNKFRDQNLPVIHIQHIFKDEATLEEFDLVFPNENMEELVALYLSVCEMEYFPMECDMKGNVQNDTLEVTDFEITYIQGCGE